MNSRPIRIFGREPTLIISAIASALGLFASMRVGLSQDQAAAFVVVLNGILGVLNALAVRPVAPAAFTYLAGALASLAALYGFQVTDTVMASVNSLIITVLAAIFRWQVNPADPPKPGEPGAVLTDAA
jgi:hypothetical protein